MKNPPAQQHAAVNIARRGPPSSTQRPNTADETPRKKIANEKIQPRSVSFQSSGADCEMPMSFVMGKLKTLKAYAWPMHRCTQSAAGGTIHRLKPGPATVWLRSRKPIALSSLGRIFVADDPRTLFAPRRVRLPTSDERTLRIGTI